MPLFFSKLNKSIRINNEIKTLKGVKKKFCFSFESTITIGFLFDAKATGFTSSTTTTGNLANVFDNDISTVSSRCYNISYRKIEFTIARTTDCMSCHLNEFDFTGMLKKDPTSKEGSMLYGKDATKDFNWFL